MNLSPIRKPTTPDDALRCLWELCDRTDQLQLLQTGTLQIQQTRHGVLANVAPSVISSKVSLDLYAVKTVYRDYLECVKCNLQADGTASLSGSSVVKVAKPFELQGYLFDGKTLNGAAYSLIYDDRWAVTPPEETPPKRSWDGQKRSKVSVIRPVLDAPHYTFFQVVEPLYVPFGPGDDASHATIIAVFDLGSVNAMNLPSEGDGLPILKTGKIDVNIAARTWMDRHNEFSLCVVGDVPGRVANKMAIRSSEPYSTW